MNLWLFIGRLNPPHIWHTWIIRKALSENDKVLVLLWTPLIPDDNNPFDFNFRKKLILKVFSENNLNILELKDHSSDLVWIKNIIQIIESNYKEFNNITFYAWDFENDSAYNVIKEFEAEFNKYNIEYVLRSRKDSFINYEWKKHEISATNVRNALNDWNLELVEKFCDKEIFEELLKNS